MEPKRRKKWIVKPARVHQGPRAITVVGGTVGSEGLLCDGAQSAGCVIWVWSGFRGRQCTVCIVNLTNGTRASYVDSME